MYRCSGRVKPRSAYPITQDAQSAGTEYNNLLYTNCANTVTILRYA